MFTINMCCGPTSIDSRSGASAEEVLGANEFATRIADVTAPRMEKIAQQRIVPGTREWQDDGGYLEKRIYSPRRRSVTPVVVSDKNEAESIENALKRIPEASCSTHSDMCCGPTSIDSRSGVSAEEVLGANEFATRMADGTTPRIEKIVQQQILQQRIEPGKRKSQGDEEHLGKRIYSPRRRSITPVVVSDKNEAESIINALKTIPGASCSTYSEILTLVKKLCVFIRRDGLTLDAHEAVASSFNMVLVGSAINGDVVKDFLGFADLFNLSHDAYNDVAFSISKILKSSKIDRTIKNTVAEVFSRFANKATRTPSGRNRVLRNIELIFSAHIYPGMRDISDDVKKSLLETLSSYAALGILTERDRIRISAGFIKASYNAEIALSAIQALDLFVKRSNFDITHDGKISTEYEHMFGTIISSLSPPPQGKKTIISGDTRIALACVLATFAQCSSFKGSLLRDAIQSIKGDLGSPSGDNAFKVMFLKKLFDLSKRPDLNVDVYCSIAYASEFLLVDPNITAEFKKCFSDVLVVLSKQASLDGDIYKFMDSEMKRLFELPGLANDVKNNLAMAVINSARNPRFSRSQCKNIAKALSHVVYSETFNPEMRNNAARFLIPLAYFDIPRVQDTVEIIDMITSLVNASEPITVEIRRQAQQKLFALAGDADQVSPDILRALISGLSEVSGRSEFESLIRDGALAFKVHLEACLQHASQPAPCSINQNQLAASLAQLIRDADNRFKNTCIPFEGYQLKIEAFRKAFTHITVSQQIDISDEEWGRLKEVLLSFSPANVGTRNFLRLFFENTMRTREAASENGRKAMRNRVAAVITALSSMTNSFERESFVSVLVDGGTACMDRALTALEEVELHLVLDTLPEEQQEAGLVNLVITTMKRLILTEIININYPESRESVEIFLYHLELFNELLGLGARSTRMNYPGIGANRKISLSALVKLFYDRLSAEGVYTLVKEDPRYKERLSSRIGVFANVDEEDQPECARKYINAVLTGITSQEEIEEMRDQVEKQYTLNLLESMGLLEKIAAQNIEV